MRQPVHIPVRTRIAMFMRLLVVQASWNYETMIGNGIAFAMEPALRLLPGGRDGEQYRAAMARESGFFNAHPYLTGLVVGGLARAELEGDTTSRIDRFRGACCGPLGSVGDQLVWAGWLPFSSLIALMAFGLGGGPVTVITTFLLLYNSGHLALRAWALHAGIMQGMKIASFLAHPVFRRGPVVLARATALVAGITVPLVVGRIAGTRVMPFFSAVGVAIAWTIGTALIAKRADGWRAALIGVAVYAIISILP
jgi:PTS system mannose-specific IID component